MEKLKTSENNTKGRKNNRVPKNSFLTDNIVNLNCCVTLSKCDALINYNSHTVPEPKMKPAKKSPSPDVQSFQRTTRKRAHQNKTAVEDITDITCSKKLKQEKSVPKPKSPQTKCIEPKIHDLRQINTKKKQGRASTGPKSSNYGINFDLLLSSGTLPYLNNSIKDTTPCVKNVNAPKDNVNDSESIPDTIKSTTVVVPVPRRSRYCTLLKKKDLAMKTTESNKINEKNVKSYDCILDSDQIPNSVETDQSSQILQKASPRDTSPPKKDPPKINKKSSKVRTENCTSNDVNLMANDTQPIKIQTRATRNRKQENSSHQNVKAKLINNKKSTKEVSSVGLNINSFRGNSNNKTEVFDLLDNSVKQMTTCPTKETEDGVTRLDNSSTTSIDVLNNSKKFKHTIVTDARSSQISKDISMGKKSTKLLQRPSEPKSVISKVVIANAKISDQNILSKSVVMPIKTHNGIKENDINSCPENLSSSDLEKKLNLKMNIKCTSKCENRLLRPKRPKATNSQKVKNAINKSDDVPSCSENPPRSPIQSSDQQDRLSLVINNQLNEKIVTKKLPIESDIENIVKRYNIPYETVKRVVLDEPLRVFHEQYSKEITPAMLTAAPIVVDLKFKSNNMINNLIANYKVEPIRESMAYEQSNIKDMMAELSKTMPSWSLSVVTNPARFVISKMSINDYGVPVVSKAIVLDRNFNGSVYINQTLEYKYYKQYTTPAEIVNLVKQINSI